MKLDGVKLKTIILKKGFKQWEVAQQAGIHEANLSKIIHGRINAEELVTKKIAKVLGVPLTDLIEMGTK